MSEETKDYIYRLFAKCVAFVFVFIIVAIVGGFWTARLTGLPVDVDKFYNLINQPFLMILAALLLWVGGQSKRDDKDEK